MPKATILQIPETAETFELPGSTVWFDEHGILCSVSKHVEQSVSEARQSVEDLKNYIGHKKVCMLSDNTNAAPVNKEMRDYAAEVIPQLAKAVAVLSNSAVGKMAANLFFSLKKQPYPVKFFNDEKEAKQWLTQYL